VWGRNARIILGCHIEEVLQRDHVLSAGALTQHGGGRDSTDAEGVSLAVQFCPPGNSGIKL